LSSHLVGKTLAREDLFSRSKIVTSSPFYRDSERGDSVCKDTFKFRSYLSSYVSFERVLREFMEAVGESVIGALLASRDGTIIASSFPAEKSVGGLARLSALVSTMAEKLCKDLDRGSHEITVIELEGGYLLITPISRRIVLAVSTSENPPLGLIFLEIERIRTRMRPV